MPVGYLGNGDTAMRTGRPKVELLLSEQERTQLQSFARSRSLPAALSNRARIVLSSADGEPNISIAERLELTKATVGKWRARFIERRIPGLYDDVRPGKRLGALECAHGGR
jgi:putative transposase